MNELELEVFRAGDYGDKGSYSQDDLDAIAGDYDPELHEAPVTLDHARSGPAYGWVKKLFRRGDRLVAKIRNLSEEFAGWLEKGAFKKPSVELYRKFESTGRPYLRALSFLGAAPPEVKGLADPEFADHGEYVQLDLIELAKQKEGESSSKPSDRETGEQEFQEQGHAFPSVDELRRERERLSEELSTLRRQKRRAEMEAFCEKLRNEGRILPAWEEQGLTEFLMLLEDRESAYFSEGEEITPLEWFRNFLQNLPPQVNFGEEAGEESSPAMLEGTLPRDAGDVVVSPESVDVHAKVLAYRERHPEASYARALTRVSRESCE